MPPALTSLRTLSPRRFLASFAAPASHGTQYTQLSAASPADNELVARQAVEGDGASDSTVGLIIPATYAGLGTDPAPAAVAGIVLGAVLGFLLLLGLVMWAVSNNAPYDTTEEVIEVRDRSPRHGNHGNDSRRRRHHSPTRSRRSRRSSNLYADEIRVSRDLGGHRSRSPPRRTQIVEERVVEERLPSHQRIVSRGPSRAPSRAPSPRAPPPPPPPPPISDIDEVIVVEESESEFSAPPRRSSRSRRRSGQGGDYRPVNPDQYAGGGYVSRPVRRRYS